MNKIIQAILIGATFLVPGSASADWLGGIAKSVVEKVGKEVASETAKEMAHQQGVTQMDGVIDQAVHGQQPGVPQAATNYQQPQRLPTAAELQMLKNASDAHPLGGAAAAINAAGVAQGLSRAASAPAPVAPAATGMDLNALFPNKLVGDYNQDGHISAQEGEAYRQMIMSQAQTAGVTQPPVQPPAQVPAQPNSAAAGVASGVVKGVMGGLFGR